MCGSAQGTCTLRCEQNCKNKTRKCYVNAHVRVVVDLQPPPAAGRDSWLPPRSCRCCRRQRRCWDGRRHRRRRSALAGGPSPATRPRESAEPHLPGSVIIDAVVRTEHVDTRQCKITTNEHGCAQTVTKRINLTYDTLAVALRPIWYSCISVSISTVGLLDIRPPSRKRPKARKYVGAAPLDRAARQMYCSEKCNKHPAC